MFSQPPSLGGGYLRMPMAWLSLPVSPQAKFLLVAFCGYASPKGESYHSFEQLGELLGRSKAAISGYVKELRDAGVLEAVPQTYGNGYNYRLLIRLRGWAEILTSWTSARSRPSREETASKAAPGLHAALQEAERPKDSAAQPVECRVQSVEHKDPKGPRNKVHKNHSAGPAGVVWDQTDEAEWRRHRPSDKDPVSVFNGNPDERLLEKLSSHLASLRAIADLPAPQHVQDRLTALLQAFVARRRLAAGSAEIEVLVAAVAPKISCASHIEEAIARLDAAWEPHWRRLSSPAQAVKTIGTLELPQDDRAAIAEISLFSSRLWIAQLHSKRRSVQMAA